ncbi:MAG: hypothetical protein Q9157_000290 [Trypethelium eluteriae]
MADNIHIPSPSVFLQSSTAPTHAQDPAEADLPTHPKPNRRRPSTGKSKNATAASGNPRPKQTKSRNGCATCKQKRLKCDETKPGCQQCTKRNAICGGYAKDFKWRTFDEPQLAQKTAIARGKKVSFSASSPSATLKSARKESSGSEPPSSNSDVAVAPRNDSAQAHQIYNDRPAEQKCFPKESLGIQSAQISPSLSFAAPSSCSQDREVYNAAYTSTTEDILVEEAIDTAPSSISSADDLLDLHCDSLAGLGPDDPLTSSFMSTVSDQNCSAIPSRGNHSGNDESISQFEGSGANNVDDLHPMDTVVSCRHMSLVRSRIAQPVASTNLLGMMLHQPQVELGCPDVLFSRFDRETCGILSVKDGPTENGWRTLVLPMVHNCAPLYHAVAALTSFHLAKQVPYLRQQGIEHMQASINGLISDLPLMRADTAVATSLALAFAESWDKKISTGIDHIKGAGSMLQHALSEHKENPLVGRDLQRLRFLCSTWAYMDVIARLTSTSSTDQREFDEICRSLSPSWPFPQLPSTLYPKSMSSPSYSSLDTLMGCASSLFPIIGHTANLVRRVCRTTVNNAPIIAAASELKTQLQLWEPLPASVYTVPEDPQTSIEDCLRTAQAYRWATLLHLFQAVPEIATRSCEQLAHQTLNLLATVPLASRAVIVQIYPLLAAGCEMVDQEMREWVKDRWQNMGKKMGIGVIEASQNVVEEVWRRRDEYELRIVPSNDREFEDPLVEDTQFPDLLYLAGLDLDGTISSPVSPPKRRIAGEMDFEYTVRGDLHWLGVMKSWEWEVLLG